MADVPRRGLEHIQRTIETREGERRREQFRQRIELARQGVKNFKEHRLGDAAKAFYSYLRILEDYKGVAENGLTPNLFDKQRDLPELLLISGVYWDLAKMYDRTEGAQKHRDFLMYLEKYLIFTKGMPYHTVAAETLRRYISKGKPKHKKAFQNTYRAMTGSNCFVATSLLDVCDEETLPRLRDWRDERLVRSLVGRAFVWTYYRVSPWVVLVLDRAPEGVRRVVGRGLDWVGKRAVTRYLPPNIRRP